MIIEGSIVLHVPYVTYYYVAPQEEGLARRIETGMRLMLSDGSFDELFNAYHDVPALNARLKNSKIFYVNNPLYNKPLYKNSLINNPLINNSLINNPPIDIPLPKKPGVYNLPDNTASEIPSHKL